MMSSAEPTKRTNSKDSTDSSSTASKHFAVVVKAEIEPKRTDEFLQLIETNASESRKEPGCLRFDVLRSRARENEFIFYELYDCPEALDYHKTQPHYFLWKNFKDTGGALSNVVYKTDGEFLTF